MQQGLMSLPGAGQEQAPGQAAPMAALPQQQPRTPAAMTGRLEGLPPQQLMMMFTNPADTTPKWAVVTAYAKAIEQQRMMDAARGQSAMQQGQAQMGQPPVAAQVMMQPPTQTARHGGIMQGYSGGGAVAFQAGGFIDPAFRKDQTAAAIDAERVRILNQELRAAQQRSAVATTSEERNRADEDALNVQRELARITGAPVMQRASYAPPPAAIAPTPAPAPATPAKPKPKSDSGVSSLLGAAALAPVPFNPLGMMSALSKFREPAKPDPDKNAREITRLQKLVGDYEAAVAGGDTRPQLLSELATARAALRGRMGAGISTIMTPQQIERAVAPSPEVAPSALPITAPTGATVPPSPAIAPAAAPTGAPSSAAAPAGITSLPTAPGAEAAAEAERLAKAREAMLEGRRGLPPELLKAREGLSAIEAANIAAQREATGAFGSESLERLQEARRRAQAPRLSDIEYLGRMLEGMKGAKRFGEAASGAAAGAGRAEGERKAALAQAEKERREDTRLIRAEEAAGRQLQILAKQRELAEKQGDFTRVQAIDDQIAGVREGLAAFKVGRADTEFEQGIKRFAAESGRVAAEAQREGAKARAAGAAGLEERQALQALRADPRYEAIRKELTDATNLAAASKSPRITTRLENAKRAAADLAASYGVTPELMGMQGATRSAAPADGKPNDPLSIR